MNFSNKMWLTLAWAVVVLAAGWLRFDDLSKRPFHFDEATGAKITAQRMKSGYQFNPSHFHGPLLSAAAAPICHLAGENTWNSMQKFTLRLVPAIAGTLLILVPLLGRKRFGDLPMLLAAAMLATSPLLIYFSRMFIHEMLLTLLGLATAMMLCCKLDSKKPPPYALVGILIGLMFSTKESFSISIIAWASAAGILLILERKKITFIDKKTITVTFLSAALTSLIFYTNFFTNWKSAWAAVETFFIYKTGEGHDKAFSYYFNMLITPEKKVIWWGETAVFLLAAITVTRNLLTKKNNTSLKNATLFLTLSTIVHFFIYSVISYKTPWLMCLPWAHVCLLAGLSIQGITTWRKPLQITAILLITYCLFHQTRLSRFTIKRFASDPRNPYAYAPTSGNIESLKKWMHDLSAELPPSALEPVAVIGSKYWPLPWYLRECNSIGYWKTPPENLTTFPVVLVMPEEAENVNQQLNGSHIPFPYTLRSQVTVIFFLRKDHWNQWSPPETP